MVFITYVYSFQPMITNLNYYLKRSNPGMGLFLIQVVFLLTYNYYRTRDYKLWIGGNP
jgi:hypothetical protein